MDENKPRNQSSDEIDLSQVFKWIGNGFRNFGNSILKALAGLRSTFFENKTFFGIVIIAGLSLSVLYSEFLNKKFYKTSMILSSDYFTRIAVESTIEKLNSLCGEAEREGLAIELGIPVTTAKNIIKFESKPFVSEEDIVEIEVLKEQLNNVAAADKKDVVKKVITRLGLDNKSAFRITLLISDPDVVKNLDSAIVSYFRSDEYIRRRIEITKSNLLQKKEKLLHESKRLDSLKSVLFRSFDNMAKQSKQGSNNVVLSEKPLTDPLSVFAQDLDFYNEIQSIDIRLYLQPDFEVIDGFTAFKEPESASLLKILATSFLVSWLAAYLILGFWKFDRYLAKLSKEAN
ncbi:MAG: hypothetical protein AABY93_00455 [Bacteroidota bacterium]